MPAPSPNPVTGLPYSLVDVDEPKRPLRARIGEADSLQWKLWLLKYAWLLSLITMAPGIALIVWTVTRNPLFSAGITALAVGGPGLVFWRLSRHIG
ncbi:MAG TPA: hypothetical protein VJ547_08300 [Candidatus Thermoplasmatota archaeon]|nr:hypothetical protein [Candidatus Thermoplasmatota archaeon]